MYFKYRGTLYIGYVPALLCLPMLHHSLVTSNAETTFLVSEPISAGNSIRVGTYSWLITLEMQNLLNLGTVTVEWKRSE